MRTLVLFTTLLLSISAFSQPNRERIEALKVSFLTKELNLSAEEAQVFWPVYNKMQDEMDNIHEQRRSLHQQSQRINVMSDQEVEALIDQNIRLEEQELAIRKKYTAELKKVISVRKVARLHVAEQKFRNMLLEELKRRQDGGGGPGSGPRR